MQSIRRKKEIPYISTREPGGIDIAEQIRGIILDIKIRLWLKKQKPCYMLQVVCSI